MYILKNALTSIKRNKGRNILIGIIVVVISASCAITLSIMNSANKIVKAYEEKYQIKANIGMNRQSLMNSFKEDDSSQEDMINKFNDMENLSIEEIEKYGDSDYVEKYYYTYSLGVNAKDLTEATDQLVKETTTTKTETSTRTETFGNRPEGRGPGGDWGNKTTTDRKTTTTTTEKIQNMKAANGAFTLMGYNSLSAMTEFVEGSFTIKEGSVSDDFESMTCVISEELATLNNISVGDKITLIDTNNTKNTYELEVTGIYVENTENSKDMRNMFSSSANTIITNSNVVKKILETNENLNATVTPTFILKSSDIVDKFISEVSEKGLSEYFEVTTNIDEVISATKSIVNVKTFATTFLIITLIIGGVVLFVINMINIRERKYEIGVLRTIGMSKLKVISQFVFELIFVAFFSLLIGAGIGSLCSVSVANKLLETEINNTQNDMENINRNFGRGNFRNNEENIPNEETSEEQNEKQDIKEEQPMKQERFNGVASVSQVDNINAVVDFKVLTELLGIGLLLTIISSLSACIAIARFSPLTILKERS